MALFSEGSGYISVGRFETMIRRILSIKRTGLLQVIDGGVQPGVTLFSAPNTADLAYDCGWYRYHRFVETGLTAGQVNHYQLANPAGSGMIGVLELVRYQATLAGIMRMQLEQSALIGAIAGATVGDTRILRDGPPGTPGAPLRAALQFGVDTSATVAFTAAAIDGVLTSTNFLFPADGERSRGIVLMPGYSVRWWNVTVANADACHVTWMERPFELSERT